jgi:hypothetical protein
VNQPYSVFAEGIGEVRILSGQDPLRSSLGDERTQQLSAALQRAACVLLVSHFEAFLKEVAEQMVEDLLSSRMPMKFVPQRLRELHSVPRLEQLVKTNDDKQRRSLLNQIPEVALLWNPDARLEGKRLDPRIVARRITSAQSDKIDDLFELFGARPVCVGDIDVPESDGGLPSPVDIQARLREIVSCRNEIAHGVADRKVTHGDVDRYIVFLEVLAQRICARAERAIRDLSQPALAACPDLRPADQEATA